MKINVPPRVVCTAEEVPSGREFRHIALLGVPRVGESLVIEDESTGEGGRTFVIEDVIHRSIHSVPALHLRVRRTESLGVTADLRGATK